MKNKISNSFGLLALAAVFFAAVLLNNVLFDRARIDLTENNIYSISDGTKKLLSELEEPLSLHFFFSNKTSEGIPQIRNYAARVQSLLEEYERYSDGKIKLSLIDPEPFSEAEDRAAEFGLTAANIGAMGDSLYFGLGASNSLDDREIIGFFDPSQEEFLEYDISKLVHKLSDPAPIEVTVISSLSIKGGANPMTGGMEQPWAIYQQLEQLYKTELLDQTATEIPATTKVLMLIHPKGLSDELTYAIDQYVMNGGRVVAFVDPHAESDMQAGMGGANSSDINKLVASWGVDFDSSKVLLDAARGLEIRMPSGGVGRHLGFVGLGRDDIDDQDVITAGLESINGASFGVLSQREGATTSFVPLLSSSTFSMLTDAGMYAMQARDPEAFLKSFTSENQTHVIATRVTGSVATAFNDLSVLPESTNTANHKTNVENAQIIVIADSDLLSDRFWVSSQNFFGSIVLQPFANNGDLATNMVENLGGSSSLISVRGRGRYARPFDVVDALTVKAETQFREKEQELEQRLVETESQLEQLQAQQVEGGALVLTQEQEVAIEQFMQEKLAIRKELREVRHQLDKDIESLGSILKFINIALAPILLTLLLAFLSRRYMRRQTF